MLQNYIKLAWRNIIKRSLYSVLNILGLSIGLAFSLLTGIYIWNEYQVNKRLDNAEDQYFLTSKWKDPNMGPEIAAPGPLAQKLKEEYPGLVANYYRWDGITSVVSTGDKHLREDIQIGDSTLLSMFGFKLLHGNPSSALTDPYSVVISRDIALKYFSKTDVLGKTLSIQSFSNTERDFVITGILEDTPENSVTKLNAKNSNTIFVPLNTSKYWNRGDFDEWANIYTPSYVQLKRGASIEQLNSAISQLLNTHAPDFIQQNLNVVPIRLTDYYLQKDNKLISKMIYALSFTGLFIMLMAVVNFINISVNSSSGRIKEIGVRKVLGGLKRQLITQFLVESVILVLISSLIAISTYPFLKIFFADMIGKPLPGLLSLPLYFLALGTVIILVLGIMAGLYPAFILSSHRSVDSLKGKLKNVNQGVWLRKSLAGLQFCIASVVMIGTFIISGQVNYFLDEDLGYDKNLVVSSQVPRNWTPEGVLRMETIRNQLALIPNIKSVSLSYEIPDGMNGGQRSVYRSGADISSAVPLQMMVTDENYIKTYGITLKHGSFFNSGSNLNLRNIILNETAVKVLGWKNTEDVVGREVKFPESNVSFTVQGITKDFHFNSKHERIQPIIFLHTRLSNNYRFLSFKIAPGHTSETIDAIRKKWEVLMPGSSFEYRFMDDALMGMYQTEIQMKKASDVATVLSFIIALMGILGLVSLNVQKKAREISIRKVLGAQITTILFIFIKEFLLVILIAGAMAWPIALYIMKNWLNDYAYRIDISAVPFILSFMILLVSAVLLIVFQTLKAARMNPVKNLRSE